METSEMGFRELASYAHLGEGQQVQKGRMGKAPG